MGCLVRDRIDKRAGPGGAIAVLNNQMIEVVIRGDRDIDGAADARGGAVGATAALLVCGMRAVGEGGEDSVNDAGVSGIVLGLQAGVADLVDAVESVLLRKVVAVLVRGVGDVHGEGNVLQAGGGDVGRLPIEGALDADGGRGDGGQKGGGSGECG